jgi:hypothetical protein
MEGTHIDVEASELSLFLLQKMKQRPMKSGSSQRYVINHWDDHWDGLTVYLDHGIAPISNIAVEQQIRNLKLVLRIGCLLRVR